MTPADITRIRLQSQHIAGRGLATPAKLVSWMGAMQAQDANMAKWAAGLRTVNGSLRQVDSALDAGILLRTHLMRPTWHLVHSDDVRWLLQLTAPQIKAAMRLRNKQLGLTGALFAKTAHLLETALQGHHYHTRDELTALLGKAKIKVNENRTAHIFMQAELDGLICSGPAVNNVSTYALLEERVICKKIYDREEALSVLAARYFRSRGPATVHDFTWWSGLPAAEAKRGLAMIGKRLACATMGRYDYWFDPAFEDAPSIGTSAYLLPAFDEFLIAYRDRTAALADGHRQK